MFATSSCSKTGSSSGSSTPTSTFDITINGHSYHLSNSSVLPTIEATTISSGSTFIVGVSASSSNTVIVVINATKSDISSALGIYSSPQNLALIDEGDGGKSYLIQSGTVNVTTSNGQEVKGTFNLTCTYNGSTYPVTGDFDYNH